MNSSASSKPARRSILRGRGTAMNPAGRFERRFIDGLDDDASEASDEPRPVATEVRVQRSRSILTRNESPDIPFDRSINPYQGCEHGCAYCFARPFHGYLGLSSGLDFERIVFTKPDAAALLRQAFAKPSYRPQVIALGTATDPYQPLETQQRITRSLLEVCWAYRHPVSIVTKGARVLRDLDLFAKMAEAQLVHVYLSLTTLEPALARRLEPRACSPRRRLKTIRELHRAGVSVGVLASPMIPGLNDHELERILEAAQQRGASTAGSQLLRLPHEVKEVFLQWLDDHEPLKRAKVERLLRQCYGGRLYDSSFDRRGRGTGPFADLLEHRLIRACQRLGLNRQRPALDTTSFRRPARNRRQLTLFG
ncbi:MAG: PA0069 family radical SAM protein [Myxococcota bacterium]